MNDAQHAAYEAYLRQLADLMQLRDWDIVLQREYPPENDCWAHIEICAQHNTAWVRVAWPEFFDSRTPEQRRSALVHELIHAHLNRAHHMMADLVEMFPENLAMKFASQQHKIEIEFATEALARSLAIYLPLPPDLPASDGS